ncbi:metallophosphoesterase [Gloeocapsa sp. PCC 7428]|uniref:metallophosphoesterase family protein n=1 Tax=Gloeocapsa sp. PCC 7428 TaxID=1173026 RepID=UPI0002A5C76F|nr:metallophosphoesterase [Gloeocapsa sp. PCC 7428]AFZ31016.1 metallophosphoesterase [Gloeocapsa sp. PCC 7428]
MSETSHRRIVIGDIHGHYDGLIKLLEAIAPGTSDKVYFLGDLIDRGPQSALVVEFVQQNSYPCLLGNHEQMLLNVLSDRASYHMKQAWLSSGGNATLSSYKDFTIPQSHAEWMQSLPTYLDLGDVWLVHAGINPKIPLEKQTAEQFCWVRDEFHSMLEPYFPDKLIITGHTITFTLPGVNSGEIAQGRGWLDIDTGAYHRKSGWLTGLDITNDLVYQVNVFRNVVRTLPLAEIVTTVNPIDVANRSQARL